MKQNKSKVKKKVSPPKNTDELKKTAEAASSAELAKPYFAGIDILKLIAVFFVIWVHTFLFDGFYSASITETKYIAPITCRWIAFTCVPIFMTITGYLMKNKTLSGKYYLGCLRVLVIYIVISIPNMVRNHSYYGTEFKPWDILKGYLEYTNANYAWYVNYYLALFFMIPFLNLAFNGLKTKKQKLGLVVTMFTLTVFAQSFFLGFEKDNQSTVFPGYFSGMWPMAYYFIGAFIREYPPKKCLRNKVLILLVLIADLSFLSLSTYNHSLSNTQYNNTFCSLHFNSYGSYPVFIAAVCIFLLFFDITTTNKRVKFVLRQLGDATFGVYLISYVFDCVNYDSFNAKYPVTPGETWSFDRFTHCYEPMLNTFFHALFWALIIQNAYNLVEFLIKMLINKKKASAAEKTVAAK